MPRMRLIPGFKLDAFIALAIPALGYWSAYLYKLGYAEGFNIPLPFVEVGANDVLTAGLSLLVLYFYLITFGRALQNLSERSVVKRYSDFLIGLITLLFIYSFALSLGMPRLLVRFSIVVACIAISFSEIVAAIKDINQGAKIHVAILKALANQPRDQESKEVFKLDFNLKLFVCIFLLIVSSMLTFEVGVMRAKTQTEFSYTIKPQISVVLMTFNGHYVTAPLHVGTKTIDPFFKLVSFGDIGEVVSQNIGALSTSQPPDIHFDGFQ